MGDFITLEIYAIMVFISIRRAMPRYQSPERHYLHANAHRVIKRVGGGKGKGLHLAGFHTLMP